MDDSRAKADIDALIKRFFAAFDNRNGRTPVTGDMTALFSAKAVIAKHANGSCELSFPDEFAAPRAALLASGELTDFHEWEESSSTQIAGGIASRVSRYAKSGLQAGKDYAGAGTKMFQLAKLESGWRIVALSWADDA